MACIYFRPAVKLIVTISVLINSSAESYHVNKEIVYVKHVRSSDTEKEYPNELVLSMHKDGISDAFLELLLEKYMGNLDFTSSGGEMLQTNAATDNKNDKRKHQMYKVNKGQSFVTVKRLSESHFHLLGKFCMDGNVIGIEPLDESKSLHSKHFFSLDSYDSTECANSEHYQKNEFDDIEEKPSDFRLSNAFSTFSDETNFKDKDRVKREVEHLTIELLMVIDFAAYSWWQTIVGKPDNHDSDIMAIIRQYYAYIFQGIDNRFSAIEDQPFIIDLAFSGLFVAKTELESYWTTKSVIDGDGDSARVMVNSSEALDKFQKWLDEADFLPKYDHAILFTGTNLTYAGSPGNTGIAFASSMCRNISNSSIVEDIFDYRTVTYATQQVARALGTRDDMDNNDCLEFFNHIMVPKFKLPIKSFGSNKWKFSKCSEQYINDYIIELNEDGLTCLKETSLDERYPAELATLVNDLPGVSYSGRRQCENAFGLGSDVCRKEIETSYSKICGGLLCTFPGSDKCGNILPADGTPCGNKKYCWQGSCLDHKDAPESSDTCVFGNEPNMDCYNLVVSEPSQCYIDDIRYKCCNTCELLFTGITGCEYGDRSDDCDVRVCVNGDQDYASKTCCLTCLDGPTPFARPILSTEAETSAFTSTNTTLLPLSESPLTPDSSLLSLSSYPYTASTLSSLRSTLSSSSSSDSSSSLPPPVMTTSSPVFSSSVQNLLQHTDQTDETGTKHEMSTAYPHLNGETSTSYLSSESSYQETNDIFKEYSSTYTYPEYASTTIPKAGDLETTESLTINKPLPTPETTLDLVTDIFPATPTQHADTPTLSTETSNDDIVEGNGMKEHIFLETTTKTSVQNKSSMCTAQASCDCPINADPVSRAAPISHTDPTRHTVTQPTDTTKCISAHVKDTNQSAIDRNFFRSVAGSMRKSQRRISSGVYQNIKALYLAVSGHLRGFQRECENENESGREGSETLSNDDDDMNKKLKPMWKNHYHDLIRDLKRDVRDMRYRVLALMSRHLKDERNKS